VELVALGAGGQGVADQTVNAVGVDVGTGETLGSVDVAEVGAADSHCAAETGHEEGVCGGTVYAGSAVEEVAALTGGSGRAVGALTPGWGD
jgi:hypothetical protein